MENLRYSVLMSVYFKEQPAYLDAAIHSMLAQTVPSDDFVVVCDGPLTPALDAVIDRYVTAHPAIFHIVRLEQNVGLGRALNTGMDACKYEYIARMDTDDIAFPDRCARQLERFAADEHLDIISGTVLEFEGDVQNILSQKTLPKTDAGIRAYARQRNPFNHPCVMYKKSAVLDAGEYQDFPLFEDYYLWIRMLANGARAYNLSDPLLYMRAGAEMYSRRGGFAYLKKVLRFRRYMLKNKHCSLFDFLKTVCGQAVICLMPIKLRIFLYSRLLRKKTA